MNNTEAYKLVNKIEKTYNKWWRLISVVRDHQKNRAVVYVFVWSFNDIPKDFDEDVIILETERGEN